MGQLAHLCAGLNISLVAEIAQAYGSPTKKLLTSWIYDTNPRHPSSVDLKVTLANLDATHGSSFHDSELARGAATSHARRCRIPTDDTRLRSAGPFEVANRPL